MYVTIVPQSGIETSSAMNNNPVMKKGLEAVVEYCLKHTNLRRRIYSTKGGDLLWDSKTGYTDQQEGVGMPTTSASVTPYEAAQDIRMTLREWANRMDSYVAYQGRTNEKLDEMGKLTKSQKLLEAIRQLKVVIDEERMYADVRIKRSDVERLQRLSQHLPTVPNLPPVDRPEQMLRAISGLLVHNGYGPIVSAEDIEAARKENANV